MSDFSHKEHKDHKGGGARRLAEPPEGDLSHAEPQRGGERRDLWFGEVPNGWEVKRLASYFSERKVKVSDKDFPPLSVTKNGILPQLENVAKTDDGDNRKLVRKGDFVINSRSDRKGSSGLSEYDGSVSLINLVLKPRGGLFGAYCNYLLKSLSFVEENYRNGRGIVADLWTTRYDEMKMIKVAMPPLSEQKAIVAYLDAETGRIDKAIAAEEKMIALLQERREIVINEAVGGGDLSHAEAQRGRGWEVVPLKSCFESSFSGIWGEDPNGSLEPAICLRVADFNYASGGVSDAKLTVRGYHPQDIARRLVKQGDLLLEKSGGGDMSPVGRVVRVNKDYKATCSNFIQQLRCRGGCDSAYICYVFRSLYSQKINGFFFNQTTGIQNLKTSEYLRYKVALPHLPEQEAIVERLDRETGKIDRAIEVKRRQIELLRERRQIVIDEVVTGKVKVA